MIEFPPQISQEEYLKVLLTDPLEKLKAIIEKNNDKYSYWSDVKYQKAPEGISSKELWCYIKASRRAKRIIVWKKYGISISITNAMQRMCHEFEMCIRDRPDRYPRQPLPFPKLKKSYRIPEHSPRYPEK